MSSKVKLNSHEKTYSFTNNIAREDVCEDLKEGKNTITLTAPDSLDIETVNIKIKRRY